MHQEVSTTTNAITSKQIKQALKNAIKMYSKPKMVKPPLCLNQMVSNSHIGPQPTESLDRHAVVHPSVVHPSTYAACQLAIRMTNIDRKCQTRNNSWTILLTLLCDKNSSYAHASQNLQPYMTDYHPTSWHLLPTWKTGSLLRHDLDSFGEVFQDFVHMTGRRQSGTIAVVD